MVHYVVANADTGKIIYKIHPNYTDYKTFKIFKLFYYYPEITEAVAVGIKN